MQEYTQPQLLQQGLTSTDDKEDDASPFFLLLPFFSSTHFTSLTSLLLSAFLSWNGSWIISFLGRMTIHLNVVGLLQQTPATCTSPLSFKLLATSKQPKTPGDATNSNVTCINIYKGLCDISYNYYQHYKPTPC